jgi:hypothetical protein
VERERRSGRGRRAVPRKSTVESCRMHLGASRRSGGGRASAPSASQSSSWRAREEGVQGSSSPLRAERAPSWMALSQPRRVWPSRRCLAFGAPAQFLTL